jgi:hypothetical protein
MPAREVVTAERVNFELQDLTLGKSTPERVWTTHRNRQNEANGDGTHNNTALAQTT